MKKMFTSIAKAISNFVNAHTAAAVATAAVVVVTAVAIPVGIHMSSSGKAPIDTVQAEEKEISSANAVSSKKEDVSSVEETTNETVNESSSNIKDATNSTDEGTKEESVSSKKNDSTDNTSSKAAVSSKKETTSSKKQTTASKTSVSSKKASTTSKKTTFKPNTKYVDDNKNTSILTGTDEDIGKVVGYSTMLDKKITVVDVTEGINGRGLRYIETTYSDGTCDCVVECAYCHEMPCPKGGGEKCTAYSVKADATKTCVDCGLPRGDGHNGTCYKTIDWDNGGKTTCHHYD